MRDPRGDLEIELVDLDDVAVDDLLKLEDPLFVRSLLRIIEESNDPVPVAVSGFDGGGGRNENET